MTALPPRPTLLLAALTVVAGAALVALGTVLDVADAAAAALIAAGLLLGVRVPWGGSVPMGGAVVTATAALLPPVDAGATLATALLAGTVVVLHRLPRPDALSIAARSGASMAGALALAITVDLAVVGDAPTLASAIAAALGVVGGDIAVSRFAPRIHPRVEPRASAPVHLTLACAGILVAVAVDGVGVAMASVAAFPLLITRFSFDRYAGVTDTLDQTVQALGLVPELAGLAPLGHSERAATYAAAVARQLGFDRATTSRVVSATRLHHIGAVPHDADPDQEQSIAPAEIAAQGARILREAGLPAELARLLESADADSLDAIAPTLEAAVVRIAATFDEIVGDDADAADRGLALVSGAARDAHSRRAAAALLALFASDGDLARDAIAAGDRFREAAVGLDLDEVTASRSAGDILPFNRRG